MSDLVLGKHPYSSSFIHLHLSLLAPTSPDWVCIRLIIGYYPYRPLYVLGAYFGLVFCINIASYIYRFTLCSVGGLLRLTHP